VCVCVYTAVHKYTYVILNNKEKFK